MQLWDDSFVFPVMPKNRIRGMLRMEESRASRRAVLAILVTGRRARIITTMTALRLKIYDSYRFLCRT